MVVETCPHKAQKPPSTPADDSSASSQGSCISNSDGQPGLSSNLLKQLATDIEKSGSIKNLIDSSICRLARILDLRPEVCGKGRAGPKMDPMGDKMRQNRPQSTPSEVFCNLAL
jgi:hypothetical protein